MTVKEMRAKTGLSQSKFAALLNIPKRTLQAWEQGYQSPPVYVTNMMEQILFSDMAVSGMSIAIYKMDDFALLTLREEIHAELLRRRVNHGND